jgi:site-specific DNA-methyltransferase (adenine-specific)
MASIGLYYEDELLRIYHGDMREVADLGLMDCVVTSPPYNSGVRYDLHNDAMPEHEYASLARDACALMYRSLGERKGRAWVNVGVTQLHTWLDVMVGAGFCEHATICWDYGIATADTSWGSWQSPSAPHLRYSWEPVIAASAGEWSRTPPEGRESWRDEEGDWPGLCRNIWRIPPGASSGFEAAGHPAVMPVELAMRAIRLSTWPGETVFDPFMGSGTTLVAAKLLGRRAVGIELSERCCEIAVKRLAQGMLCFEEGATSRTEDVREGDSVALVSS